MEQTETQIKLQELYDAGKTLAKTINKQLETNDGERLVQKVFIDLGIDPRTQRDLQILIPKYMLQQMQERVDTVRTIVNQKAISYRNISQAIKTAKMKGADNDSIDKLLLKNGYEQTQFEDFGKHIGLVISRRIIDDLAFLMKDISFGLSMGRFGAKTNVLKEAQGLGRITTDVNTYLRFASGLTPNYFNNCWGTSAIINEPKELGAKGAKHHTSEVIWNDVLGIRPTIHEFGYTVGLFDTAMFEVLRYFKRSPQIYKQLMKELQNNEDIRKKLALRDKNNLSNVQAISTSASLEGLRLKEGEITYQYFLEKKIIIRYELDAEWNQIEKTRTEIGEINQFGEMNLNGILYNSEVSLLAIDWYESAQAVFSPLRLIGKLVEKQAEKRYLNELYVKIQQERVGLDRERLKQLEDALETKEKLVHETEALNRILEGLIADRERIFATFTHELGNDIFSTLSHLRLIKGKLLDSKDSKKFTEKDFERLITKLDLVYTSNEEAASKLNILKESAKAFSNLQFAHYDIVPIITSALESINHAEDDYKVTINLPAHCTIYCDDGKLRQVLLNVFKNSYEAMKETEKKELYVAITKIDEYHIAIEVKDTGCGFPKELIQRGIRPFYTTKKDGTGLGLYISSNIIALQRGKFSIDDYIYDKDKKGGFIRIELPIIVGDYNG